MPLLPFTQTGSNLYDDPPHRVDIYNCLAPGTDSGGGVRHQFPAQPDQSDVPCQINTNGASVQMRQGQGSITVGNRISFLSSHIKIVLSQGAKMIARDTGRVFIMRGMTYPNRQAGRIPPMTYVDADEIL